MSTTDLGLIEAQLREIRALLEREHGPAAVTLKEAARLLSCSERHVQRLVNRGELATVMVGSLRRVSTTEIRRITSMPEVGQVREERPAGRRRYSAAAAEAEYARLRPRGKRR